MSKYRTLLFENFDFSVFDNENYGEDAVREDIVAPLLRELGYSESGDNVMLRTPPLVHPYFFIGTQKKLINIFPDYLLKVKGVNVLVLDAKRPNENITQGKNTEQVYSYAIHRDVRTLYYALCNGREITVFQISKYEPILHFPLTDIQNRWDDLFKTISPLALTNPKLLNYKPDFGFSMMKLGLLHQNKLVFVGAWVNGIGRISDDLYTLASTVNSKEDVYFATFDFPQQLLSEFFQCVPKDKLQKIKDGLSQQPFTIHIDNKEDSFELVIEARFGDKIIKNKDEEYLPLIVKRFNRLPS